MPDGSEGHGPGTDRSAAEVIAAEKVACLGRKGGYRQKEGKFWATLFNSTN